MRVYTKRNTKTEQIKDKIKDNDNDKLPNLEIKKFGGNAKFWQNFIDSFETVIDISTNLNNVEKPKYLTSYLERDAPEGIAGLLLTDSNYNEALEVLKKKYRKPDVIINLQMSALIKISTVVSNDVRSLRRLYHKIESDVCSLLTLGIGIPNIDCMVSAIVLGELPVNKSRNMNKVDVWGLRKIL